MNAAMKIATKRHVEIDKERLVFIAARHRHDSGPLPPSAVYNVHTNDLLLEILVEIVHITTMFGTEPIYTQSTVFIAAMHRHDSGPIPPSLVQFVHTNELLLKTYVELEPS